MFINADEFPLPYEYRFFDLERGVVTEVPDDLGSRIVVFLDCGNIDRAPEALRDADLRILNVDHHHDNTRFGTIDHVVARGVVHGGDRLGPHARARRRGDARDRRRALRRPRHRHRQVHVREHRHARARHGRAS